MLEELLQDGQELIRRIRDVMKSSHTLSGEVSIQLRHAFRFGLFDRSTKGVPTTRIAI